MGGGGLGRGLPAPPFGGGPRFPTLAPLLSSAHSPPGLRVRSGSRGRPGGGGVEGRPVDRSPRGPFRPEPSLCPPRVSNGHGGGHGGRGPHTVLVRRRVPPLGLLCAPLRRAGVGSPVGRDPRGSRRLGALGRVVCRSSRNPRPRFAVPSGGGGASPRLRGGGGSLLWPSSWGQERGGGGWGVRSAAPRPPAPSGVGLPSVVSGAPPRGILVPWGLPGGHGRRARPGRPPMGQCSGGGGEGGGNPPALVRAPAFPRPASEGAAPIAPSWAPPVRRRPVHRGRLPRPRCPLTPGAAASSGGVRGRRLFGLPRSALGPEGEGGGGGGASGPPAPPPHGPGGAAWRSLPRGPAVGWGVALFPRPPLLRAGPSCRPSLGSVVPPAYAARRWPAGRGREG